MRSLRTSKNFKFDVKLGHGITHNIVVILPTIRTMKAVNN